MDKENIQQRVARLQSKEDLLSLLNDLKNEDLGHSEYAFTITQLNYFCNPNNTRGRYTSFEIKKKSGGVRHIDAPRRGLMNMLYYLNKIFQAIYTPSPAAMGFVSGKSVVDNAVLHVGKNYVFNIDLKDFFPSITQPRVWKRLQLQPLNIAQPVANVIAGLCCMKKKNEDGTFSYILPQGAPTSPIITNMICDKLDRRLLGLATRFNLTYSRYADDITFSSNHYVYAENGEFRQELERIITDQGFAINEKKTRLQKKVERQEVTGLVVNEKNNVTRNYIREIRSILYIWEKYGYMVADGKFRIRYNKEKGHVKKGNACLENVLSGKLLYLKMVKGVDDSVYIALQDRFNKLTKRVTPSLDNDQFGYIYTMNIRQFEEKMGIKIEQSVSKGNNTYYYIVENGNKRIIKTSQYVKENGLNDDLFISLCESSLGKSRFYLLHKKDIMSSRVSDDDIRKSQIDDILSDLVNSNFDLSKLQAYGAK